MYCAEMPVCLAICGAVAQRSVLCGGRALDVRRTCVGHRYRPDARCSQAELAVLSLFAWCGLATPAGHAQQHAQDVKSTQPVQPYSLSPQATCYLDGTDMIRAAYPRFECCVPLAALLHHPRQRDSVSDIHTDIETVTNIQILASRSNNRTDIQIPSRRNNRTDIHIPSRRNNRASRACRWYGTR